MNDTYIVYCLYTKVEGVFYIGCGQTAHGKQKSRLGNTVRECQNARQANYSCLKCRYIRACLAKGIQVETWVTCTSSDKQSAEEMEYALIQLYPYVLTNSALNWHPMQQLPAFLSTGQERYEEEARERAVPHDLSNGGAEYARPERLKLAVDAIMAHNDAQAQPAQKWYINEKVVGDLLGGEASHEKSYLIRRYLLSRCTEIAAHHQKHQLKPENNQKLADIAERMKVERVGSIIKWYRTDHFKQATDTIIAYNDSVNDPALRWYISPLSVADLLGGWPIGMSGYPSLHPVARYLAGRRDEIIAHHQKHGLARQHSRKSRRITDDIQLEPEGSGEE
jgi:hypothetical protein